MVHKSAFPTEQLLDLASDLWSLTFDSLAVIGLRTARMAVMDRGAFCEWQTMFQEKASTALELNRRALSGDLGRTQIGMTRGAVRLVGKKVAANRRRLSPGAASKAAARRG